jgi:hypothetical protein
MTYPTELRGRIFTSGADRIPEWAHSQVALPAWLSPILHELVIAPR